MDTNVGNGALLFLQGELRRQNRVARLFSNARRRSTCTGIPDREVALVDFRARFGRIVKEIGPAAPLLGVVIAVAFDAVYALDAGPAHPRAQLPDVPVACALLHARHGLVRHDIKHGLFLGQVEVCDACMTCIPMPLAKTANNEKKDM